MKDYQEKLHFLTEIFISKIASILSLKNFEFEFGFASEFQPYASMSLDVPGVMLSPDDIMKINTNIKVPEERFNFVPTVVINDYFKFNDELELLGIIAHELRHVWQYHNVYGAKDLLKQHITPNTKKYYDSKLEMDAYAFQMVVLKTIYPTITIKEVFENFKGINSSIRRIERQYKLLINEEFKEF